MKKKNFYIALAGLFMGVAIFVVVADSALAQAIDPCVAAQVCAETLRNAGNVVTTPEVAMCILLLKGLEQEGVRCDVNSTVTTPAIARDTSRDSECQRVYAGARYKGMQYGGFQYAYQDGGRTYVVSKGCQPITCPAGSSRDSVQAVCVCDSGTENAGWPIEGSGSEAVGKLKPGIGFAKSVLFCNPSQQQRQTEKPKPISEPEKTTVPEKISVPAVIEARVVRVSGTAERDNGRGGTVALERGTVIREGESVVTGLDSEVTLDFGYGEITIGGLTAVQINKFFSEGNLRKTELYMRMGAIRAHIKPRAAIRSDFTVRTPVAITGVRGSEMVVAHDEGTQKTTMYVTEDKAYIAPIGGGEREVTVGNKAEGTAKGLGEVAAYAPEELPTVARSSGLRVGYVAGGVVVLVALGLWFAIRKRKDAR